MSESQSMTNSLPRDLEKSNARFNNSKTGRLGVAFDPSAGPAEAESSKVRHMYMYMLKFGCSRVHLYTCT